MYARARKGEITGFPGVDVEYEAPDAKEADLTADLTSQSVPEIVHSVVLMLESQGLL